MFSNKKFKKIILTTIIASTVNVNAIELLLTDEPLYLNQTVPPALAITFDDSGSMSWGWMPSGISYGQRSRASPDYNALYFDPTIDYKPPKRADGTSFPDSNYEAAQFDGFYLGGDTSTDLGELIDLSDEYRMVWKSYPYYSSGNTSSRSFRTGSRPSSHEGYYYSWNGPGIPTSGGAAGTGAGEYTLVKMNSKSAAEKTNFANWYTYYNTRGKLAKSALSHAFVNFGPDFKIDWQQLNHLSLNPTGANMNLFSGSHREDFYDWLYSIRTTGGTPLRKATFRASELFRQGSSGDTNSPYYDANYGSELSCQQNFHIAVSDGGWNGSMSFSSNADNESGSLPAIDPTGVNLTYNYSPSVLPSKMYSGSQTDTMADYSFKTWREDLRGGIGGLENRVPPFIEDYTDKDGATVVIPNGEQWWQQPELFWNPSNDPATWQHVVNYNIGLGVFGALDPELSLAGLRDGTVNWPGIYTTFGKIDDVFHASINSRGKFFSAKDPTELAEALNNVVSNIITRKGRASAGTVSSNVVSASTLSFKTGFDSSDWSGSVVASILNPDGSFGAVQWDASCKLTGGVCPSTGLLVNATVSPSSREIITFDNGSTVDFTTGTIPSLAYAQIQSSTFVSDNNAFVSVSDVVNYIRGDRSNEIPNGLLRKRRTVLGDIIHSSANVIRGPSASYDDEIWQENTPEAINRDGVGGGYEDFRQAYKNRKSILLAGANDGMLHAFDTGLEDAVNGGDELWAYLPSSSFEHLADLADPAYQHKSFVDAAPFVKDALIAGSWGTYAVGNLRHGGKMFYALDLGVTPKDTPSVMWEFTDPDLGYTYSGGIIARVYNPSAEDAVWVAFLPNGYNSDDHKAAMYAVDLESGNILHKWKALDGSVGKPNGMGPPTAADFVAYDSLSPSLSVTYYGADQATDFVYAGDLHGNLYKFNTLDIFSGSTQSVPEIIFNGNSDQPITTPPRIFSPSDTTQDVIITFGTGKYIESPDRDVNLTPPQYIIGIRDSKDGYSQYSLSDSRFVTQTITESGISRFLSSNPVSSSQSWKLELPTQGERMVNLMGRNNSRKLLIPITIIPTGIDPCLPGGESWIMAIDSNTGGAPDHNIFNSGTSIGVSVDSLVLGVSLITTPGGRSTFLNVDTTGNSNGVGDTVNLDWGDTAVWGRKSWHRIILD